MKRLFFIFSMLLATYLLLVAFYFSSKEPSASCKRVEIHLFSDEKSKSLISKEQLLQEINEIDSLPLGKPITSFNTQKVEETLIAENAIVSDCNLFFRPNGTLSITVTTQYPQFLLQTSDEAYFVTAKLKAIPISRASAIVIPLPVVYGAVQAPFASSSMSISKTNPLFNAVEYILTHPKWRVYFSDFYVDPTQNLFVSGAVAGFVVEIGRDWTRIATQLDNLDLFLSRVEPKMGCNTFSKINLTVPGKVIATPRADERIAFSPQEADEKQLKQLGTRELRVIESNEMEEEDNDNTRER